MAAVTPTYTDVSRAGGGTAVLVVWTPVTSAGSDTCVPAQLPALADKSIHVSGTFGGGTVTLGGSNNGGSSYIGLTDPTQTAISITSEAIKAVLENTQLVKPVLTGGSGTSLTISMLFRSN